MKYAIVENGGKQYKAVEGETIEVDRMPQEVGKKVELKDVLLVADGEDTTVGTPTVAGAKVSASVVEQFKGAKILVFKYKPRIRYRVRQGHRQSYTRLLIESIETKVGAKKKEAQEAAPKADKAAPTKAAKEEAPKPKAEKPAAKQPEKKEAPAPSGPSPRAKLSELGISTRNLNVLEAAGITTAGQLLKKLAEGDEAALAIEGFGPKGLEETQKALKKAGYDLPK